MATNPLRRRFDLLQYTSFVVFGVLGVSALLLAGHTLMTAFAVGMVWGVVPLGLGWGLADLLAPAWVILWRERLIINVTDIRKPVGDAFSATFQIRGDEPWKNPAAQRRVRALGAGLTGFWIATIAVLVWIPQYLDGWWAGYTSLVQPK